MSKGRPPLFTSDDIHCADALAARYKKVKKPLAPVKEWLELLRMATNPANKWAIAEALKSPMLDEHRLLLTEMRSSGELDRLIRERALSTGGFFREAEIERYYRWRDSEMNCFPEFRLASSPRMPAVAPRAG